MKELKDFVLDLTQNRNIKSISIKEVVGQVKPPISSP